MCENIHRMTLDLLHDAVCVGKQVYGECFGHETLPPEANVHVIILVAESTNDRNKAQSTGRNLTTGHATTASEDEELGWTRQVVF